MTTKILQDSNNADFAFKVGADFVLQLEDRLTAQKDLAEALGVSESAVSQKLNSPGNLKLETMIKYARALGMKVSVVLYDDGDRNNERGPIHSEIFKMCWEKAGKPKDFWQAMADWADGISVNHEAILETPEQYPACPARWVEPIRYEWSEFLYRRTAENTDTQTALAIFGGR